MSNLQIYAIRWRLVWADGRVLEELPAGSSIMERHSEAPAEIQLIDLTGQAVQRVPIPKDHKPVFYRQRSMGAGDGSPSLDATVFGFGRMGAERVEGSLWLWQRGQAINCPQRHIAQGAIEMQIR